MTTAQAAESLHLEGFLAPVSTTLATDLPVTGRTWNTSTGVICVTAQPRVAEVDPATHHWFTGDAMVHRAALRDGKARWYRTLGPHTSGVRRPREPISARPHPRTDYRGRSQHQRADPRRTLAWLRPACQLRTLTDELDTVGTTDGNSCNGRLHPPIRSMIRNTARGHRVHW